MMLSSRPGRQRRVVAARRVTDVEVRAVADRHQCQAGVADGAHGGADRIRTAREQHAIGHHAAGGTLVGERGRGFYHLLRTLDHERILAGAIALGIASAAFDEALRYARQRHAFGRPIGGFQAIQHMLADTAAEVEQARLLLDKAAWLLSEGRDCSTEAAMAKLATTEVAVRATDRGMRVLAGYGLVEESPMERLFRDARLGPFSPISNEMVRNFVGERLGLPKSY